MKLMIAAVACLSVVGLVSASAEPFSTRGGTPAVGQAYVYSTTATGSEGNARFKLSTPPPQGDYMMSFIANFNPLGSSGTPVEFSCWMQTNRANNVGQSTTTDAGGGYDVGVSGQNFVHVVTGANLGVVCGEAEGDLWTFANVKLKVTLVRLDGKTTGTTILPAVSGALVLDRAAPAAISGGPAKR